MELYLNSFGSYLYKSGELFLIKISDKTKKMSPKRLSSIIISSAATISTDAIQLAMEHNIDIIFIDKYGNPYGRIWFPKIGSTTYIRRRLLEIYNDDCGLEFVLEWVLQKVNNQIDFIKLLLSKRPQKKQSFDKRIVAMEKLKSKLLSLTGKLSENSALIMAYEGNISRYYFGAMSDLLPERYAFKGRSSRPAKDTFNAFLNYGYGILYSKVERALIIAGLDPYIGLLHSDNYNKKSLVFDFIESYRIFVEQPVFYLFSRCKVKKQHYKQVKNGFQLNEEGKKFFVAELLEHFSKTTRHKSRNIQQINQIQLDAHAFANELIADNSF
ncbi:CRISPR-associated endonuclease Cas1 [Candidatus Uabimicrobium sp. HlEnr_7]|uniref:CRISPR-associated endonuclease Cas1 n=1 Tax=Candidatus Uabimicrobium helgolandensis TaxID=3095367 RepID=UPI003555CA3F